MGQPLASPDSPAPTPGPRRSLGQHTDEVLRAAGYADGDIADLSRRAVVAGRPAWRDATKRSVLDSRRRRGDDHARTGPMSSTRMNTAMRRDLVDAFSRTCAPTTRSRVIVVTGAGERAFSAGADIREFLEPPVPDAFREERKRLDYREEMDRCPQPIIAAIRGFALGGGLELALACDIRIAGRRRAARTHRDQSRPSSRAAAARSACLGWSAAGKALEMILTGARVPAAEALRHRPRRARRAGCRADAGHARARTLDRRKGAGRAPLREGSGGQRARDVAGRRPPARGRSVHAAPHHRGPAEGARAFVEKRKPKWAGR